MANPAEIARGLTADERKIMLMLGPEVVHRVSTYYPMLHRLRGKECVEVFVIGSGFGVNVTPLGVAVREEIQKGAFNGE